MAFPEENDRFHEIVGDKEPELPPDLSDENLDDPFGPSFIGYWHRFDGPGEGHFELIPVEDEGVK